MWKNIKDTKLGRHTWQRGVAASSVSRCLQDRYEFHHFTLETELLNIQQL
jgi:hypothetical protein